MDPTDVALHEAVTPQPSKRQWIQSMSALDRDYMLRYVSCTIALQGGMTAVTRSMISAQFLIDPALTDVIASWVMSQEVEDNKLPDDQ